MNMMDDHSIIKMTYNYAFPALGIQPVTYNCIFNCQLFWERMMSIHQQCGMCSSGYRVP